MMSEYKQQDDEGSFGSKFKSQDVGFLALEEKCLQPLAEVKSEPEEVKEDFGEVKSKCDFEIKVEDEETKLLYQLVPFAKDQVQGPIQATSLYAISDIPMSYHGTTLAPAQ